MPLPYVKSYWRVRLPALSQEHRLPLFHDHIFNPNFGLNSALVVPLSPCALEWSGAAQRDQCVCGRPPSRPPC